MRFARLVSAACFLLVAAAWVLALALPSSCEPSSYCEPDRGAALALLSITGLFLPAGLILAVDLSPGRSSLFLRRPGFVQFAVASCALIWIIAGVTLVFVLPICWGIAAVLIRAAHGLRHDREDEVGQIRLRDTLGGAAWMSAALIAAIVVLAGITASRVLGGGNDYYVTTSIDDLDTAGERLSSSVADHMARRQVLVPSTPQGEQPLRLEQPCVSPGRGGERREIPESLRCTGPDGAGVDG